MSIPLITRAPSAEEIEQLRLVLSTFCDGSGQTNIGGGTTIPGWRDLERSIAAVFNGIAPENKQVFDVLINSTTDPAVVYGISAKSKKLSGANAIANLAGNGRVYMELANSPAAWWDALEPKGVTEADFQNMRKPKIVGQTVLEVVQKWHTDGARQFAIRNPGRTIDLERSVYLTLSYGDARNGRPIEYQIHTFDLQFPAGIRWRYRSGRCLQGMDPNHPNETLFDLYALSGGQLKYYPKASYARFSSPVFLMESASSQLVLEKAARYWPEKWKTAGGMLEMSPAAFANEVERLLIWIDDPEGEQIARKAIEDLRGIRREAQNSHQNSN